jgi:acetyltransferase-like isoleucine patch superfamily enzyme
MLGRSFRKVLSRLGLRADEGNRFFTSLNPAYAEHRIGKWTYGAPEIPPAEEGATVTVGKSCSFAGEFTILRGHEHRTDWVSTYPFAVAFPEAKHRPFPARTKGNVVIGHDVWFGMGALILSGVTIGNGACHRRPKRRDARRAALCGGRRSAGEGDQIPVRCGND